MIEQIAIALTGATAVWLSQDSREERCKLVSWFLSAAANEEASK